MKSQHSLSSVAPIGGISRRKFLQTATAAALLGGIDFRSLSAQNEVVNGFKNLIDPSKKLRIASIGAGGQAFGNLNLMASEDIVALCDVDFSRAAKSFTRWPNAARFQDFREMFREMADKIDAVLIATPDHTHFPAAMMALEYGKHIYVEKPLTHTIGEARLLREAARKAGVVTQMGNHGHANETTRLVKEWIDGGVIGEVRKVHFWTNRPVWPQGLELPSSVDAVPATLNWNLWQGVAPVRPYNKSYLPFAWRSWWDYGCGALGDMGCQIRRGYASEWADMVGRALRFSAAWETASCHVVVVRWWRPATEAQGTRRYPDAEAGSDLLRRQGNDHDYWGLLRIPTAPPRFRHEKLPGPARENNPSCAKWQRPDGVGEWVQGRPQARIGYRGLFGIPHRIRPGGKLGHPLGTSSRV
jgi:hypothetical protein